MTTLYVYHFAIRDWNLNWNDFQLRVRSSETHLFKARTFHTVITGITSVELKIWKSYLWRSSHFTSIEEAEEVLQKSRIHYPACSHGIIEGNIPVSIGEYSFIPLVVNTERLRS